MSKLKTNTIQHTGGSADNITLDNSQNVTVENNLTVDGTSTLTGQVSIGSNGTSIAENNLNFQPGGAVYIDHRTTGQDIQVRMSTSSALDTTGPTFKSNGNLAFASGKGIDFSANSHAGGMTSETLDSYEEGTWTPADASGQSISFSSVNGYYTKIGQLVHAQGSVTWPSTGGQAGFGITLPFTAMNNGYTGGSGSVRYTTKGMAMTIHVNGNAANFAAFSFGGTQLKNADMSTDRFDFQVTYRV